MTGEGHAAVGNGVEEGFAEIEGGVHADREPQASGAAQSETPEEAGENDAGDADPGFSGVGDVDGAEGEGRSDRSPPKTRALGQSKLRVTAKCEFFEQADDEKKSQPESDPSDERCAMNLNGAEVVVAQSPEGGEHGADFEQAKGGALPETPSQCGAQRYPVVCQVALLESRHYP